MGTRWDRFATLQLWVVVIDGLFINSLCSRELLDGVSFVADNVAMLRRRGWNVERSAWWNRLASLKLWVVLVDHFFIDPMASGDVSWRLVVSMHNVAVLGRRRRQSDASSRWNWLASAQVRVLLVKLCFIHTMCTGQVLWGLVLLLDNVALGRWWQLRWGAALLTLAC